MREGDLKARAPEDGGDEIALVARAFNRMGEQLAERDETLRTVDLMRRQMLADVSHELKTPLTAMRGFIETLQMPQIAADEERRTRYFATLERETRRLERIVADLLDVARLENNAADFDLRVFSTRRLFEQVARRNERVAAGHRRDIRHPGRRRGRPGVCRSPSPRAGHRQPRGQCAPLHPERRPRVDARGHWPATRSR